MSSANVLNNLARAFLPYAQIVYDDLKLSLRQSKVDLEDICNGTEEAKSQFKIILPYCSKKLKWEVIFDSSTPWFAPDFRFDDESFLSNIDEDFLENKLPSLANWNKNDPNSLCKVISELIDLYKIHQIKKLNEDESSRASFEYSALLNNALTSENDIEVWVDNHVEFLIKLNVDVSRLPELYNDCIEENPGLDSALLLVRYPNSANAELILSPFLTKILGIITLPAMHQGDVLIDYVPMVTELLNNKIQEVLNTEQLKRDLFSQLIVKYEGAVLEHEANKATFLFETNDFHWILQIDIGTFPTKPPIITLRSVYHSVKGKPKVKVLPPYPNHNFEEFIENQVEIFKNECKGVSPNNQLVNVESNN